MSSSTMNSGYVNACDTGAMRRCLIVPTYTPG